MMDWEKKDTIKQMASEGDGTLPRVLLLGDSISLGYTPIVVEKMKDRAFVTRPACNCGPSATGWERSHGMSSMSTSAFGIIISSMKKRRFSSMTSMPPNWTDWTVPRASS